MTVAPPSNHGAASGRIDARMSMMMTPTPPVAPLVQSLDEASGATGDGDSSNGTVSAPLLTAERRRAAKVLHFLERDHPERRADSGPEAPVRS